MRLHTDPMENLLAKLGEAHRDGAFSSEARRYPWRTVEAKAAAFLPRRFAWVRVAAPLAAAAAVAVLFVGPNLWTDEGKVHDPARMTPATIRPETPGPLADAEPVTTSALKVKVDCDYNGDGEVDGRDIQAFVNRLKETGGDPNLEVKFLQQCLLGQ